MRIFFLFDFKQKSVFILLTLILLFAKDSIAQKLNITDFVIYAGKGTVHIDSSSEKHSKEGYGIRIGNLSKIKSGSIGSYNSIKTTGKVTVNENMLSSSIIRLAGENTVNGSISAANLNSTGKFAFYVDEGLLLNGNVSANGNIFIGAGVLNGTVIHPPGTIYTGPVPQGGEVTGTPLIPSLPENPPVTFFAPAGTTNIASSKTIGPGGYNKIKLTGNNTVTFSGPGIYIFNSINNSGYLNKFVFDFKNNPSGIFQLQIYGDVDLGKLQVILKNGGTPSRIYAETHGNGESCPNGPYAWSMGNGFSQSQVSEWTGTVYAPYGGIKIGSAEGGTSSIKGALWSGTQVNIITGVEISFAPFSSCTEPDANAGPDKKLTCADTLAVLDGSSLTSNVKFCWKAIDGGIIINGENTATPTVSKAGTYVLTVINPPGDCKSTDTTVVTFIPCILPYYPPPENGKVDNLIGAELNSLFLNFGNVEDTLQNIFTILHDSVLIEVISLQEKYETLLALLQTPDYGLTDLVKNGQNSLIITGKYPIARLRKLDSLPQLINYCRPVYPPLSNSGIINSSGDTSLYTNYVRNGFGLTGKGVKVGVISNSYNTIPGNPAQTDIVNGDLPGTGNPDDPQPLDILKEYPYGRATDEGRAMLQIVHDIAPEASLAFRTGFISSGDFAEGIKELQEDSCNIIVDDVTFITEPFFEDGVVARAVDDVTAKGVSYFTAAGNYGNKSYRNAFNPVAAPAGITGFAHDFGGGDIYQSISLVPGTYTIVLQWADSIYSLSTTGRGAKNDFDIYLRDNNGNTLFGFNRNNIGGDPIEVIPFTVTTNSQTNIMIVRAAGTDNLDLKYVVFRGDPVINEYNNGTSTILGQANALGAMSVGAVLYTNTPAYGVNPPTIASFSSGGGNPVNGIIRNKPDFTGPNGINTTVYLGGSNIDGDLFPNFFGTSAAAPHIAATAALIIEARQKFYNDAATPEQVRTILQNTAVDMDDPGFDYTSGYGFIQADSALRSIASPTPFISKLILPDTTVKPGEQPFEVTVKGNYLSKQSYILFRGNPLPTRIVSSSLATATIPSFTGNPAIQMYTAPITPNGNDGGYSDSLFFFSPVKKTITVTAKNTGKKYGEKIPAFETTVLIDSIPLDSTSYTLHELGLDSIYFTTPATTFSNTGIYFIRPAIKPLNPNDSVDIALMEMYNYVFNDGLLSIQKIPLLITPKDTTLNYGDKIAGITYNFNYPDSLISLEDRTAFLDTLQNTYVAELADATALADARALVNGRALVNSDLKNLSFLVSARALVNARPLVNASASVNRDGSSDTTLLVDIAVASIFHYQDDSASTVLVNARPLVNARALVNARPLVNGTATVNARPLVNGSSIVNGNTVGDSTHSDVTVIIDEADVNAPEGDSLTNFKSINLITGTTAGEFAIVPGALLSENYEVTYALGKLNILPYTLSVKANDTTITYGSRPLFTSTITGYQYDDDSSILEG
ncbi:MAG: S8 family serine peptidase, partial [Panacibacter sp.]